MKMCGEAGLSCCLSLCISLAHPDSPESGLLYLLIHNSSLGPRSQPYRTACTSCLHCKFFDAIQWVSVCVCFPGQKLAACLLFCTRMVRNVLGSLLYTQAVWPHVQNGASILLVIIMPMWGLLWLQCSQKSLLAIYHQLKMLVYHHKAHSHPPDLNDLCSHTRETYELHL